MIWEITLVILSIILYVFILQPLIPLIRLKMQYGNQAKLSFYPILGDQMFNKISLKKYNDEIQYRKEHIRENKDLKFILTNLFNKVFIIILDPTYYKEVYVNHSNFVKYDLIGHNQLFDQGLLFSIGDIWQLQRNMLGPSFNYDKLKDRFPMMNEVIKQVCQTIETTDLLKLTSKITGQIVLKSFFGKLAENQRLVGITDRFTQVLVEAVRLRNKNLLVFLKISILKQRSWSFPILKREKELLQNIKQIRKIVEETVSEGIKNYDSKKEQQDQGFLDVMISHYLKDNAKITKEMIVQQFITLVFAGTHTTSTAVVFCLYFLSKYPDIQNELLAEIHDIIGNSDICNNNMAKLVKLDAFIKESIRLKNPTPQPVRRYVKSDVIIQDLRLKKNWIVSPSFEVQVTNEKYIDNPYEFNYKRWIDGNVFKEDNGFLYIPFSAGGRNCIGQHMAMMEMKLILIHLIQFFKIESNEKDVQFPMHFTYTISPGDFAKLVRRM